MTYIIEKDPQLCPKPIYPIKNSISIQTASIHSQRKYISRRNILYQAPITPAQTFSKHSSAEKYTSGGGNESIYALSMLSLLSFSSFASTFMQRWKRKGNLCDTARIRGKSAANIDGCDHALDMMANFYMQC